MPSYKGKKFKYTKSGIKAFKRFKKKMKNRFMNGNTYDGGDGDERHYD